MSGETLVGSTAHYRFDGGGGASAQHRFGSQSQLGHPGKDELGNCRNTLRARPTPRVPFCGFDRYCSGFVQYIGIPTFRREAPSLGWRLKRHIETKKKIYTPSSTVTKPGNPDSSTCGPCGNGGGKYWSPTQWEFEAGVWSEEEETVECESGCGWIQYVCKRSKWIKGNTASIPQRCPYGSIRPFGPSNRILIICPFYYWTPFENAPWEMEVCVCVAVEKTLGAFIFSSPYSTAWVF